MKKVGFHTLGCKVNQYETEAIIQLFVDRDYTIVSFEEYADIYIINTCTVTNMGDKKSRQMIRRAKKINPDSVVVVVGCYAQIAPEEVLSIEGVSMVLGTNQRNLIVDLVEKYLEHHETINAVDDIMKVHDFEELTISGLDGKTRAYLKIQEGCNQFCSYCIIPYTRGPIRSRSSENIIEEVKKLVSQGFKEIVLTGIHIASYGKDLKEASLLKIMEMVHPIKGLERIRLGSIEPTLITDSFVEALNQLPKVCHHFHLSLQSGCNETLKRMNRKYTTAQFQAGVELLRKYNPHSAITTDIIVGFPGETDAEFEETYDFVKKIGFSQIHVFKFSPRKGTPAAKMKNQVSGLIKESRSQKMISLGNELQQNFITGFMGATVEVLFEQPSLIEGHYEGYTKNYIKVAASSHDDIQNKLLNVRINEKQDFLLLGQIV